MKPASIVAILGLLPGADAAPPGPLFGGVLLADQRTDNFWLLRDLNGDGDADDEGEFGLYFDGIDGATTGNPFDVHVGRSGFVYAADGTTDAVYRLEDVNHDGDAADPGEATVWFSDGGNDAGFTLPTPNGVYEADDGAVYIVNAGTGSVPADAVYRTVDLDGDGSANGPGEATVWIDLSVLVSELLGASPRVSSAFDIVFIDDTAYIIDSVGGEPDVILAARDADGSGAIESGELSLFIQDGDDPEVTDLFTALTKRGRDLISITFFEDPPTVYSFVDANANGPGGVVEVWNGTNVPPGADAGFAFGMAAAPLGSDIYTTSNLPPGGVFRLVDVDGDGLYNSEGEAILFRSINSDDTPTERPRNVEVLPEFFQARGYYAVSNVDDLNDVPYDLREIVALLRPEDGSGPDYAAVLQVYEEGVSFRDGPATLAGFASGEGDGDGKGFRAVLPEAVSYFGTRDFLDDYLRGAIAGAHPFDGSDDQVRIAAIETGVTTLFSYWVRFKLRLSRHVAEEDGNLSCKDGAPHLLDESFAIYYGPRGRQTLFSFMRQLPDKVNGLVNTATGEPFSTEDPNLRIVSEFIDGIESLAPSRPPLGSDECVSDDGGPGTGPEAQPTPVQHHVGERQPGAGGERRALVPMFLNDPPTAMFPNLDVEPLLITAFLTACAAASRVVVSSAPADVPALVESLFATYAAVAPDVAAVDHDADEAITSQIEALRNNPTSAYIPGAILVDTFDKLVEEWESGDPSPISPPDVCGPRRPRSTSTSRSSSKSKSAKAGKQGKYTAPHEVHQYEQVKFNEEPEWECQDATIGDNVGCIECWNPRPAGGEALIVQVKAMYKRSDFRIRDEDQDPPRDHCIFPNRGSFWTCFNSNLVIEPDTAWLDGMIDGVAVSFKDKPIYNANGDLAGPGEDAQCLPGSIAAQLNADDSTFI